MLAVSRKRAIEIVGHAGITSDGEMHKATNTAQPFRAGPPPHGVVAVQKHREPNGEREHWTLWSRDKTLDPANLGDKIWPVSKHLVIDWANDNPEVDCAT